MADTTNEEVVFSKATQELTINTIIAALHRPDMGLTAVRVGDGETMVLVKAWPSAAEAFLSVSEPLEES